MNTKVLNGILHTHLIYFNRSLFIFSYLSLFPFLSCFPFHILMWNIKGTFAFVPFILTWDSTHERKHTICVFMLMAYFSFLDPCTYFPANGTTSFFLAFEEVCRIWTPQFLHLSVWWTPRWTPYLSLYKQCCNMGEDAGSSVGCRLWGTRPEVGKLSHMGHYVFEDSKYMPIKGSRWRLWAEVEGRQ